MAHASQKVLFILLVCLCSKVAIAEPPDPFFTYPDFKISKGVRGIFGQDVLYFLNKTEEIILAGSERFKFRDSDKARFQEIRHSLSLTKEQRLQQMLDAYIDARLAMLRPDVAEFVRTSYKNLRVNKDFKGAAYDPVNNVIQIPEGLPNDLLLSRAISIVHELEHAIQKAMEVFSEVQGFFNFKEVGKFYLRLISLRSDYGRSLNIFASETFSIGAQWEFAKLLSADDAKAFEEEAFDLWIKQDHSEARVDFFTYELAPRLYKFHFLRLMLGEHGYSAHALIDQNRGTLKDRIIMTGLKTVSVGACVYTLYSLGKLAGLIGHH